MSEKTRNFAVLVHKCGGVKRRKRTSGDKNISYKETLGLGRSEIRKHEKFVGEHRPLLINGM